MSMKLGAGIGSPPIPTQVDWQPETVVGGLLNRFIGQEYPERETVPLYPAL